MNKLILTATAGLLLALGACQPPPAGSNSELIEQMAKDVAQIKKDVAAIKKGGGGKARPRKPQEKPQTAAYKIPTGASPALGAKNAKVSVVVFSDFQCPFCSRIDPMLKEVAKDPELKGKVNIVFKHFPLGFHKDARPAAKASLAAQEQGKFWEYSDKLMANQKALKAENFSKWAKEIGLDVARFEKDLKENDAKYEAHISADQKLGSTAAKVRGTPSIYVGGWQLKQRSAAGIKALIKDKKLL
ncbi:MAG: thioredoxin domain-containing protein [Deltaproteobacteria bacterium]|nr:thioredoxin domain-containing protein [Deltaproteobacteria bacterium]